MNDLSGLDWTAKPDSRKQATPNPPYTFANLRPTPPISGRSTPLNGPASNPASKPTTPANDSFANLVSFNSATSNSNKNLSLQERQRLLAEEKKKQNLGKGIALGDVDEQIWQSLGSGRSTPAAAAPTPTSNTKPADNEDDFLAVFNQPKKASTPVPVAPRFSNPAPQQHVVSNSLQPNTFEDDDDPFGLNQLAASARPASAALRQHEVDNDDDDVLGLLARPAIPSGKPVATPEKFTKPSGPAHPQEQAVAELVDMGFPPDKARQALESTESGTDVQAAVGFLLSQAHSESRQQSRPRREGMQEASEPRDPVRVDSRRSVPSPSQAEKAPADIAAELSTKFLKTAGTFWKQSTKKLQQAVEEFNSDSDSSQPRWMREPERPSAERRPQQTREDETGVARRRRRSSAAKETVSVTDEAMMLETARPEPRRPVRNRFDDSSADTSRDHSPAVPSRLRESIPAKPAFLRPQRPLEPTKQTLSRTAIEEEASQAYVSSARRRKAPVAPTTPAPEPDLFNTTAQSTAAMRGPLSQSPEATKRAPVSIVVRPAAPSRNIPPISAIALKSSHSHREAGNAHFKRGDYAAAHASYSTSLSHLPKTHPITMVLLTNHALTALKIGESKTALTSADSALTLAGPAKGEGETIDLGTGDTPKPMRDYVGKALMRKAEALEQMERWTDAAAAWREAVEGGHGGATSIQGRARAEKAAHPPPPKPAAVRKPASTPARKPPAVSQKNSAAAVQALRAANAAADKADDEKFALSDIVDAKLAAWRGSRADNLRALLGSLDVVLWPEAGWKKISMADLVLPGKVKVQYMKGIAKVHPDKIATDATTEQRMIAGAVFSTLNEAWEKFKAENGL